MPTGFTPEQKRIILFRDFEICPICYQRADQVNHRANRGAGGYQGANILSNGVAICWRCNGLIESDAGLAQLAVERGVKISRYSLESGLPPTLIPYLHPAFRILVYLRDDGDLTFDPPPTDRLPGLDSIQT